MKLSEQQLNSFIELYKQKYGVLISSQEALEVATRFLKLVEVVESKSL